MIKIIYLIGKLVIYIPEFLYSRFVIERKRDYKKYPLISDEDIIKIVKIEQMAFPQELAYMRGINSVKKLIKFCSCCDIRQIYYKVTDDWYFILVDRKEFFSFISCGDKNKKCKEIFTIYNQVKDIVGRKMIIAWCRKGTSYALVKLMEKRGNIEIIYDEIDKQETEEWHNVRVKIVK